jgi:hypothetical protein
MILIAIALGLVFLGGELRDTNPAAGWVSALIGGTALVALYAHALYGRRLELQYKPVAGRLMSDDLASCIEECEVLPVSAQGCKCIGPADTCFVALLNGERTLVIGRDDNLANHDEACTPRRNS